MTGNIRDIAEVAAYGITFGPGIAFAYIAARHAGEIGQ